MKKYTVIKFGGSLTKNPQAQEQFLDDLAAVARKEAVILVHGGGPEINQWLNRVNIPSKFVNGLRYTDGPTLEIVEMVLSGKVNKYLAAALNRRRVPAVGISGRDGFLAVGKRVPDLGFVAEPARIQPRLLMALMAGGYLPVVSSIGTDAKGQAVNMNADSLAMAIAIAVKAARLILLTDVAGVLDAEKKTIPVMRTAGIPRLLRSGVVTGGMIPKVKACAAAVRRGVAEVWIADGVSGLKQVTGTVIRK